MSFKTPIHFTQAYNKNVEELNLEFFDTNLLYDTPLFIDPFLIRNSNSVEERELFERFGDFFRYAYDISLGIENDPDELYKLQELLNFHEPKEIGLGYTEYSHKGSGPGPSFSKTLLNFFIGSTAKRLVKEEGLYPNGKFNPITLEIFVDKLGPDGLSDISAHLILDYLIQFTQQTCKKYGIPTTKLPVRHDGFDFSTMEWKNGGYYNLPENTLSKGQAVILVPKHFLRSLDSEDHSVITKVRDILSTDPTLSRRFFTFLEKKLNEVSIKDVRSIFLEEESVFKKFLEKLSEEPSPSYDFEKDISELLAIKKYKNFFSKKDVLEVSKCDELYESTLNFIDIVVDHWQIADGWKDMWEYKANKPSKTQKEVVIGRIFRGMGLSYFSWIKEATFISEAGTGNGPADFFIVMGECRIIIELKKLSNGSPKGTPPIPSYIHGIERQLVNYSRLKKANYAIYITCQHYTAINRPRSHHGDRVNEINKILPKTESKLKKVLSGFKKLHYINIVVAPHPTASNL